MIWFASLGFASEPLPVRDVAYTVQVRHAIAEATFAQTFVNDREHFVEGVYTFPLPEHAAVDGIVIDVGGRRIEGRVEDRAAARVRYRAAVAEGRVAALAEESRPNVFVQRVGNVPPGGTIEVTLRLVQPVPRREGTYELALPLVVAPRFVPDDPDGGPDWEPGPLRVGNTPLSASVDLTVASALPILDVTSPTHPIAPSRPTPYDLALSLRTPADRDVVLRWTTGADGPQAGLVVQDGHALLTVEAPASIPRDEVIPRELAWIVDHSCSMRGEPLAIARAAMTRLLDELDERDSLWLLPSTRWLAPDSVPRPVDPWTRALAHGLVASLEPHGQTHLLEALQHVLSRPPDPDRERAVIVVSDGLVANDRDVLRTVAELAQGQRVFAIGPGSAPNRFLLGELGRITGGEATFVSGGEDAGGVAARFLETLRAPVLTDLQVDWGDWVVDGPTPDRLPAVYADRSLQVVARVVRRGTTPITVRGRAADGPFEATVLPRDLPSGRALPSTWARRRIEALDRDQQWRNIPSVADRIRALSLEYQVSSRYTSLLAIDTEVSRHTGEVFRAEQPSSPPAGADHFQPAPEPPEKSRRIASLQKIPAGRSYQATVDFATGTAEAVEVSGTRQLALRPLPPWTSSVLPFDDERVTGFAHQSGAGVTGAPRRLHHTRGDADGEISQAVRMSTRVERTRVQSSGRDFLGLGADASIRVAAPVGVQVGGHLDVASIDDPLGRSEQADGRASARLEGVRGRLQWRADGRVDRIAVGLDVRDRRLAEVTSTWSWGRGRSANALEAGRLRAEALLGQLWGAPALTVTARPRDGLELDLGASRDLGHLTLPAMLRADGSGPSRLDAAFAALRVRSRQALLVQLDGALRWHRGVPTVGGARRDRFVQRARLLAAARLAHWLRVDVELVRSGWTGPSEVTWVDDGTLDRFATSAGGRLVVVHDGELRMGLDVGGAVVADPMGWVVSEPGSPQPPGVPHGRLHAGLKAGIRRPDATATAFVQVRWFERLAGGPPGVLALGSGLQSAVLPLRSFEGWQLAGGAQVTF